MNNNFSYRKHKRKSFLFKLIINLTGHRGAKVIPEKNIYDNKQISSSKIGS